MAEKSLKEGGECGEVVHVPINSRTRVCLVRLSGWPVEGAGGPSFQPREWALLTALRK